ncbi:hypothetical protein ADIWIN_3137 [Winogradskyella psychrotolerans RS-3]|uniref:Uncharacterized protein n=1 Tax=Winogradskyella psychrotolerans RS-3 TaxID=641526 RepID=S7WYT0_9FLAO|nr:hypothetical protein ADIWIN_3137 [Winogradskyella psychrotolerans RS-3]
MHEFTKTLLKVLTNTHFMLTQKKPFQNMKWLFRLYSSFSINYLLEHE